MRIMVMGAGAIGSLFGGYLSKAGNDILLVGRKKHIKAIRTHGLVIRNGSEFRVSPTSVDTIDQVTGSFDLILLTVKAYDVRSAVLEIQKLISDTTTVMFLQNGLGIEDTTSGIVEMPIRGITMNGALLVEPGVVMHTGRGDTIIGELNGKITPRIKRIADTMTEATLNTKITENIGNAIWMKTIINSGINPLGALTGMKNGELLQVPSVKEVMIQTVKEGMQVAEQMGISLEGDAVALTLNTAEITKNNRNSMLQDISRKKRTEIDFINGAISKYGKKGGVATPINDVLTGLIHALEQKNSAS